MQYSHNQKKLALFIDALICKKASYIAIKFLIRKLLAVSNKLLSRVSEGGGGHLSQMPYLGSALVI